MAKQKLPSYMSLQILHITRDKYPMTSDVPIYISLQS